MNDWLDRLTTYHRLPTMQPRQSLDITEPDPPKDYRPKREREKPKKIADPVTERPAMPMAESMYILKYGKKAYREWQAAGEPREPDNTPSPPKP